jgi:low affinity Fe/Cu permease
MKKAFRKFASAISNAAGNPGTFLLAVLIVIGWAISGPHFGYSNTWQLVINTGTTIVTFLMVFLIQNTQNRDGKAMQLKLDELIRASQARDSFIDLEDLSDEDLAVINKEFQQLTESKVHPALQKMHHKILAAHSKRQSRNPSLAKKATLVAEQVVSLLNPFSGHDKSDKK